MTTTPADLPPTSEARTPAPATAPPALDDRLPARPGRGVRVLTACFGLTLVALILIANLGLGPRVLTLVKRIPGEDYTAHFLLMGFLALLLNLCLSMRVTRVFGRSVLLGSAITMVLVVAEECSQAFVPSRTFDLRDLACDFAGIVLIGRLASPLLSLTTIASAKPASPRRAIPTR